jgi:hypothetical protein
VPLPRNNLYILVRPETEMKEDADKTNIFKISEYFIKVKYNLHHQMRNVNYHFQGNNKLNYQDYSQWFNTANVTWSKIMWYDSMGGVRFADANYKLLVTKSSKVRLDSMCALRQNITSRIHIKQYETNLTNAIVKEIVPGTRYYMNVFAEFRTS